jgi:putative aldouronate transport system permease protein
MSSTIRSRVDLIFDICLYIILGIVFVIVAYPIYFIIISSVSLPSAVSTGQVTLWPVGFTLEGYAAIAEDSEVLSSFLNSIWYTVLGTTINVVVTVPVAYALSRSDLRGRMFFMIFFLIPMYVNGGLIPTYLVIRDLGMMDTVWSITVTTALSVYNMIIAITFFRNNLSSEILEAARIDGCSNTKFFFRIAVPLSGAIIAILVLYYGVGHWNSYFNAMIYLSTPAKWPLQLVLRKKLILSAAAQQFVQDPNELQRLLLRSQLMKYTLIIVSSAPVMCLYPFIQKHFVKGVMIGSVKG